ncbi:MAG: mercury methylation corrinoid protein HgcA [Methanomassiliicoccales archaeon]|nr:mercury methylation corrinoid protein HgcA [Methanomassiliicoccales archaeon]
MDETYAQEVQRTAGVLGRKESVDHARARLGFDRMGHRVRPGLYAIGAPDRGSKVLVTANYTLSFDAVRSSLHGRDAYILVLDTKGINVWCAAGKGTFGTAEVLKAVEATNLKDVVDHRALILPQLSASGVTARDVKEGCGFKVEFGPVRAEDLPSFLDRGVCTEEMRTVRFDLKDRLVLAPVELRNYRWGLMPLLLAAIFIPFYGSLAMVLTLGGLFLFPALLPYLPGKDLSFRGMVMGALLVTPFALYQLYSGIGTLTLMAVAAEYLLLVPWLGYLGLNFTGSTTFASRTGVKREIFTYIPAMVFLAVVGGVLAAVGALGYWGGWF